MKQVNSYNYKFRQNKIRDFRVSQKPGTGNWYTEFPGGVICVLATEGCWILYLEGHLVWTIVR